MLMMTKLQELTPSSTGDGAEATFVVGGPAFRFPSNQVLELQFCHGSGGTAHRQCAGDAHRASPAAEVGRSSEHRVATQ